MSMFRMAFATDQHINLENTNSLGVDLCGNFTRLLAQIKDKNYDVLVLGGDLCFDQGDSLVYTWFQNQLANLDIPVFIIPGNHDSAVKIHQVFGGFTLQPSGEYYGKKLCNAEPMFFLDTSRGSMSDSQYLWLENELSEVANGKVFVCMHHPPVITGSKHMDSRYAFKQIDRFYDLTQKYNNLSFHIFAGHCHMERTISVQNVTVYITPSSYVNIDPEHEDFVPLTTQKIGYRECIWDQDRFYTNVYYLP